jgi:hypothetical protein
MLCAVFSVDSVIELSTVPILSIIPLINRITSELCWSLTSSYHFDSLRRLYRKVGKVRVAHSLILVIGITTPIPNLIFSIARKLFSCGVVLLHVKSTIRAYAYFKYYCVIGSSATSYHQFHDCILDNFYDKLSEQLYR